MEVAVKSQQSCAAAAEQEGEDKRFNIPKIFKRGQNSRVAQDNWVRGGFAESMSPLT